MILSLKPSNKIMENSFSETQRAKAVEALRRKRAFKRSFLILALFILLFSAALLTVRKYRPGITGGDKTSSTAEMKKFKSYDELLAFMEDNENSSANASSYMNGISSLARSKSFAAPASTGSAVPDSSVTEGWGYAESSSNAPTDSVSSGDNADYSTTNIQVAGVDEGDIVKNDGNYIYAISGQKVIITQAVPADQAQIISSFDAGYTPSGLYISGDKLAVFGSNYNIKPLKEYSKINGNRNKNYSDLTVYDISDRKNPKQEKQYDFEGSYQDSRMIGDYIYFITSTNPSYIYYDNNQPIPYVLEDGAVLAPGKIPEVYYFDFPYLSQNFTTVTAIDIKDSGKDVQNETYVLDGNQNYMYVSQNNIFITFSKYTSEQELMVEATKELLIPKLNAKDQERIKEIEDVKSYILNSSEKSAKIAAIFERYYASLNDKDQEQLNSEVQAKIKEKYEKIAGEMQKTVIHKIAIQNGDLQYKSQGEVSGKVLNKYSMDESADGYFRIATTVDASWSLYSDLQSKSYSNLFVLDSNMKKTGEIKNIAEGESIYSVRFMQDRAYMVTFQRVDPLFVISLADPGSPQIIGQLKVPGYSTYLHPYDDNKIIGLGKNTDNSGKETGGIKLSLFDASDVSNPKEISKYVLGEYGSDSLALSEPKAFLFSKEKNLLAIPAVVRTPDGNNNYYGKIVSAGLAVFNIDDQGFTLKGLINHSDKTDKYYYERGAKRSLYIGDNIYSLSDNYLKINRLSDLENVKSLDISASGETSRGGSGINPAPATD